MYHQPQWWCTENGSEVLFIFYPLRLLLLSAGFLGWWPSPFTSLAHCRRRLLLCAARSVRWRTMKESINRIQDKFGCYSPLPPFPCFLASNVQLGHLEMLVARVGEGRLVRDAEAANGDAWSPICRRKVVACFLARSCHRFRTVSLWPFRKQRAIGMSIWGLIRFL